ncbi:MAG: hypothetical protein ACJAVM_001757 [Sulfitobacter sp.]|jgi:hypothetical protein
MSCFLEMTISCFTKGEAAAAIGTEICTIMRLRGANAVWTEVRASLVNGVPRDRVSRDLPSALQEQGNGVNAGVGPLQAENPLPSSRWQGKTKDCTPPRRCLPDPKCGSPFAECALFPVSEQSPPKYS